MTNQEQHAAPVLSVYMLTYNHERFVAQAIDSILAQEMDFPFELVISDDCSTDATAEIVGGYAAKYPDIVKFKVNEKNLGLIPNYFATVERCRGKYVALCAGDDWWTFPGKSAIQVKYLEDNPEMGMVYTSIKCVCEGGKKGEQKSWVWGGPSTGYEDLMASNDIPAVSAMMRRELVLRYVSEIDPVAKGWLMEDFPMWLWFAQESRIAFLDTVTAVWRIWQGSVSHPLAYIDKVRFRASVTESGHYFARRYFGESAVPDDINIKYFYELFDLYAVEGNADAIRECRDIVMQLRSRVKTDKTAKMSLAVRYPAAYCTIRSLILRNRS